MDLREGCGTIRSMRWLIASMLAVFVTTGVTMGDAEAQAFKPRGGAKATPAKSAPAKKASPAKKAAPKKAKSAKKSARAAQSSARTEDLTPDDSPAKRSDPEDDDDYVVIVDD